MQVFFRLAVVLCLQPKKSMPTSSSLPTDLVF
uniref:Uncharacterized protein n=1 Tax=Anguilla anguilla TaxID=7936 RepID=A0A0E9XQ68_ANGAN